LLAITPHADEASPAAEDVPELEIKDVSKLFGQFKAVDQVSLSVRRGEFVTILGASGSGKTTTLMMVAGFDYPSSGEVKFRGQTITYMPAHLRNMGMVFQNYALFPHLSVFKNIAFPLKIRRAGARETEERVRAALDLVRLGDHAHKLPIQLSGGQQQRVALARALVFGPSLLLMDEPLGALDKSLREQMQLEIKRVQAATGVTIISVTHDQDEALAMSDRIVVMDGGRVETVATPADVYQRPASRMVAEFMKETNILQARVTRGSGGELRLAIAEGFDVPLPRDATIGEGAAPVLCLRPERIQLSTAPLASGARPAIISDVIYLGDVVKYYVVLDDIEPKIALFVKALASDSASLLKAGTRVGVDWHPDDIQILPG
jgi:putative spermidine/putrescine transport system ATP-binding protein